MLLSPTSQAALTGAVIGGLSGAAATVISGVLRDFVAKSWTDRREDERTSDEIYRRYAEPLAAATTSLLWRLKEIFAKDGRGLFLIAKEPRTLFEEYKLRSTYYRLAALLGWLRALRRELSFLRLAGKHRIDIIEDAIDNLERSIADGHHVEHKRLDGLLQIWSMPQINNKQIRLRLAVDLNYCVKQKLQTSAATSPFELSDEQQQALCLECATLICKGAKFSSISSGVLKETQNQAIRQIALKEAWLYRDWQTAIGDLVLRESTAGDRRFDVIGFGEFEAMMISPTETQFLHLSRISTLFYGVNVDHEDSFDARSETLQSLLHATATLIQAIHKVSASAPLLNDKTINAANEVLRTTQTNNPPTL